MSYSDSLAPCIDLVSQDSGGLDNRVCRLIRYHIKYCIKIQKNDSLVVSRNSLVVVDFRHTILDNCAPSRADSIILGGSLESLEVTRRDGMFANTLRKLVTDSRCIGPS